MEPIFFRPGGQVQKYKILRRRARTDERGRITYQGEKEIGELEGSIADVGQTEKNQWKQAGHPITHQIIVRGRSMAQAEDVLLYNENRFYVQGVEDPGGMGFFQIIYCEKQNGAVKNGRNQQRDG